MKRKREYVARLGDAFERLVAPKSPFRISTLFRAAAFRVLTGNPDVLPSGWSEERLEAAAADDVDRMELLAFRELAGQDISADLQKLAPPIDQAPQSVHVTMTGLAWSMQREAAEQKRWSEAALARMYRESEQVYLFEMLSLMRNEPPEAELAANAVALVVQSSLARRDDVVVAPLVCGLGILARRAGANARDLLFDRLAKTDDLLFADGDTPRFTCKGPSLEPAGDKACELQLAIDGEGPFDAGADPAAPVTRFLTKNLIAEIERLRRRKGKAAPVKAALKDGTCTTLLRLGERVTLEQQHESVLRRRVGFAWECARHQLEDVACSSDVRLERG